MFRFCGARVGAGAVFGSEDQQSASSRDGSSSPLALSTNVFFPHQGGLPERQWKSRDPFRIPAASPSTVSMRQHTTCTTLPARSTLPVTWSITPWRAAAR